MLIFNGYNGLNFDAAWQVEWANAVANRKPKVRPPKPPDFLAAPLDSSSKKRKVEEQSPVPAEKGEAGPPEKMMKAAMGPAPPKPIVASAVPPSSAKVTVPQPKAAMASPPAKVQQQQRQLNSLMGSTAKMMAKASK